MYAAARAGEIDAERYDSYCRMRGAASALDAAYDDAG